MARIQLRDTTIYIQDGLAGTAQIDEGNSALAVPAVSVTSTGSATTDAVQVISQFIRAPSAGTYDLILDDGVDAACPVTVTVPYNAPAETGVGSIEEDIDLAMTAAGYTGWVNGHIVCTDTGAAGLSDGDVTLTFSGGSVDDKVWNATVVDGVGLTVAGFSTLGAVGLDNISIPKATNTDLVPVGARFTIATETGTPVHTVTARDNNYGDAATLRVAFTPDISSAVDDPDAITWLPQRIEVKIGDGDLSWTEAREMIYDLDRDQLDTVRQGQDQPVEVDLAFTFEYVTTESGQLITPIDAIKNTGEASEWVSSSDDTCEPYAVDLYVIHCVPCGTDQDEDYLFPDFRYENLDYSMQDATISVSGRCNATDVTVTRDDFTECA